MMIFFFSYKNERTRKILTSVLNCLCNHIYLNRQNEDVDHHQIPDIKLFRRRCLLLNLSGRIKPIGPNDNKCCVCEKSKIELKPQNCMKEKEGKDKNTKRTEWKK